jgi:hypothetical protein
VLSRSIAIASTCLGVALSVVLAQALLGRKVWPDHQDQPARKVLPDQWDPKVRLDCKAPKACVERLARPDNLERPAHLECQAPRASAAR